MRITSKQHKILNALARGDMPQSDFTKSENAILRKLWKRNLVTRSEDMVWSIASLGEELRDAGEGLLEPALTEEGEALLEEPVAEEPVAEERPKPKFDISVATQICTKCKEEKEAENFSRDRSRKSGLDCWCRACNKAHAAARKAEKEAA